MAGGVLSDAILASQTAGKPIVSSQQAPNAILHLTLSRLALPCLALPCLQSIMY